MVPANVLFSCFKEFLLKFLFMLQFYCYFSISLPSSRFSYGIFFYTEILPFFYPFSPYLLASHINLYPSLSLLPLLLSYYCVQILSSTLFFLKVIPPPLSWTIFFFNFLASLYIHSHI